MSFTVKPSADNPANSVTIAGYLLLGKQDHYDLRTLRPIDVLNKNKLRKYQHIHYNFFGKPDQYSVVTHAVLFIAL